MLPDLTEVQEIVRKHGLMHIKVSELLHRMVKNNEIKYYKIHNSDIIVRGNDYLCTHGYTTFDYCIIYIRPSFRVVYSEPDW